MIDLGENIIIIWKLSKSRSVAPAKLEIKLVSPNNNIFPQIDHFVFFLNKCFDGCMY